LKVLARSSATLALLACVTAGCAAPGRADPVGPTPSVTAPQGMEAAAGSPQSSGSASPEPPSSMEASPVAAGEYTGMLTITRDDNRMSSTSLEMEDLSGTTLRRTLSLGPECDLAGDVCTASSESLGLSAVLAEDGSIWETPLVVAEATADSWTATFTEEFDDDCVELDGTLVGTFHTTATTAVTLSRPGDDGTGTLMWMDAHVSYREDSVGSSEAAGCYTANYAVDGTLTRP